VSITSIFHIVFKVQSVHPDFTKYAHAVTRLNVRGVTIAMANDEDLMDLFKEMQVTASHRVEFKVAVAGWRADPQEV